jgi:hypothetical protein
MDCVPVPGNKAALDAIEWTPATSTAARHGHVREASRRLVFFSGRRQVHCRCDHVMSLCFLAPENIIERGKEKDLARCGFYLCMLELD